MEELSPEVMITTTTFLLPSLYNHYCYYHCGTAAAHDSYLHCHPAATKLHMQLASCVYHLQRSCLSRMQRCWTIVLLDGTEVIATYTDYHQLLLTLLLLLPATITAATVAYYHHYHY